MINPVVELQNIQLARNDNKILSGIDLAIHESEFVIVLGPNGSGKSTLQKVLNGTIQPDCGHVYIDGHDVTGQHIHKIAQRVATLTQDVRQSTFSELSVLMNLLLAMDKKGEEIEELSDKASYVGTFNITLKERMHVLAGNLSGGQRQSLALAMCFAQAPRLLLLDEHTSALDPKAAHSLMEMTNTFVCEKKLTTLMITHNLEHALNYGTRLIILQEGTIARDFTGAKKKALTKADLVALAY